MRRLPFAFFCCFIAASAQAGVGKISSPAVERGVWELEYGASRTGDNAGSARNNEQSHQTELEYGVTDRLRLGAEFDAGRGVRSKAVAVKAQYEFTEQGDWWLGSAIKGEYAFATHEDDSDEAELKWLLERRDGPWRTLANLSFSRGIGANRDNGIGVGSRVQETYHWTDLLSPGLEWHADYGALHHLNAEDERGHYVGPMVTGTLLDLGDHGLDYTLGYYRGLGHAAAENAARLELDYDFRF